MRPRCDSAKKKPGSARDTYRATFVTKGIMNQLANIDNSVTMTSLELVQFINNQREVGAAELAHSDFLKKVPIVLSGGAGNFSDTYVHAQNGQTYPCYRFPKREACLMAMSYSYDLQAKVFDRMTELEAKNSPVIAMPNFNNPAEAARAWALAYEAQQLAESTKAQIGHKREATAMNTASQAVKKANKLEIELDRSKEYASVKRMEMLYHGIQFSWRLLKSAAADLGIPSVDVFDANYGTVKAYHASVWREAYALDIGGAQ